MNAEEQAWEERDQAYGRAVAFLAGIALGLLIALAIVLVGAS